MAKKKKSNKEELAFAPLPGLGSPALKNLRQQQSALKSQKRLDKSMIGFTSTARKGLETTRPIAFQSPQGKTIYSSRILTDKKGAPKRLGKRQVKAIEKNLSIARDAEVDARDRKQVTDSALDEVKRKITQDKINRVRKITEKQSKKFESFSEAKHIARKILRKGPRPTLDLRRRPEREEPVKQHGFKEEEIGNNNFLFN